MNLRRAEGRKGRAAMATGPCHVMGRWPRRAAHRPVSGGDTGCVAPCLERLRSKEPVSASGDEVTRETVKRCR
jgi:hypothetical protein